MIKKIELRRFKKFKHTTIELKPLSVLIGENSCGKTTVLQAINLSLNAFSRLKIYTTENGVTKPRRKGVGQTQLPGFLNSDFRELYYAKKSRNSKVGGTAIGCELFLTDDCNNVFGLQISSLFGGYNLTPLSTPAQINNKPTLHTKESLLISGFVGLTSFEEKALSLAIRNRLRDGRASEIIRNLLLDTKDAAPDNYHKLVARLKKDFNFQIDNVSFDESEDINVHAFYDEVIEHNKIPFDFCASGSGIMQVLQIITPIYRYCPLNSTVVLLDEPDAHLHSNMQVALFYSLREIQKELGIQIIISTHSTSIISAASPSEIIPISDAEYLEPLTKVEEVEGIVSERIDSNELSKVKTSGVLVFFEDKNIDYFIKCDQVLGYHCLVGRRTVAYLTGRTKDDKFPFGIKPVLQELLSRETSVFAIRDRDGLTNDITDIIVNIADKADIDYNFLNLYEIESYLLIPDLIHRALESSNPEKELPSIEDIEKQITNILADTIKLAKYKYNTTLEDCLAKISSFEGLEEYRGSNIYRGKAEKIRADNEKIEDFEELRRVGMGKETLKEIMAWINGEKKLKLSTKAIIDNITEKDIPKEISDFLDGISSAIK